MEGVGGGSGQGIARQHQADPRGESAVHSRSWPQEGKVAEDHRIQNILDPECRIRQLELHQDASGDEKVRQ